MTDAVTGFEPVLAPGGRLLILGTAPSRASLEARWYYAHPRNAFWPMMAQILSSPLPGASAGRARMLASRGIFLWDVLFACRRAGSLDADIREETPNPLPAFLGAHPSIERILFNGAAAERLYLKHFGAPPGAVSWARMPSTSPAYTLPFTQKLARWRAGMEGYYDEPIDDHTGGHS